MKMSEQMTQFQKDLVRMLDSMREQHKGEVSCLDIDTEDCEKCPLAVVCGSDNYILFEVEKAIEIVTQWAKEHPFVTYEQKYEETFGVKPISDSGEYVCPWYLGLKPCNYAGGNGSPCAKCAKDFWQSEYRPPKADKGGEKNE